jgi:tetratricopeptide (TPR) repeat protein
MRFSKKLLIISFLLTINISFLSAQFKDASNEFSYALKLYDQKFYDLAAQQFIKYYNRYQGSENAAEAKFYAGMSLFKLQDYNNARIEFQSLALEYPKSAKAGESWFKIGESYAQLNNFADAAKSFETLKTLYPKNPLAAQALYFAGKNYMEIKDFQKAKSVLAAILDRYPDSAYYYKALLELARIYQKLDKIEQTKIYLKKTIANSTNKNELAEAYFTSGAIDLSQGYVADAEQALTKVIKDYPDTGFYSKAAFYLGKINLQKNKFNLAIEFFDKCEDKNKDPGLKNDLLVLKGDTYFLSNKFAFASKLYDQVKVDGNDSLEYVIGLKRALSLRKQGLKTKSFQLLADLLKALPSKNKVAVKTNQVYINWLLAEKKYNTAISFILQKLKNMSENDNQFELLERLGYTYQETNRWRDLIRELEPFLNSPNSTKFKDDFLFYLANAYYNIGKYEQSAHYFDIILKQFSASTYYQKSDAYYQQLVDYKIIDQNLALRSLAAIVASEKSSNKILLGKFYYNDLKDYQSARAQFEQAIEKDITHKGEAHLYLGKALLKLSRLPGKGEAESQKLLQKASQNFQLAVENIKTCQTPDEASWLMVRSRLDVDTISVVKQNKYIETLLTKYKNSPLKETWLATLAFDLAFVPNYEKTSQKYFLTLIKNYPNSSDYASYVYGYAKLINANEPETAVSYFKKIALEHSDAPEAVLALQEVARYYEENKQYKEAVQLYSMLVDQYYYSEKAELAANKLGELNLKASLYDKAIHTLKNRVTDPFINDLILSKEFLSANVMNNLVFMGIANRRLMKIDIAQTYFSRYLSLMPNGPLKNIVSFELAELYYNEGRTSLALDNFKNVSKQDSTLYNRSLLYRANILYEKKEYTEAARAYKELDKLFANKKEQKDIKGKFILSKIKTGAISESEKLIKAYKKKFPREKEYLASFTIELGEYQRRKKNFDSAIKYYKRVKSKYDDTSKIDDADYYIALTYVTLNKNEQAFDILTNFYKNYSKSDKLPEVLNTLGTLYFRVEKYDNAISAFKNALQKSVDKQLSGQIMGNLIKTYTLTGFWDAAQGLARKYVEEFPEAKDILDKKMIIAQAFTNLNQFQNAVEYLKRMKLEADSEKEPEIQFYIGEALLKAGRYEEAVAEFVKIPLLSKRTKLQWEASALYYSGQAYEKLGRIPDAIRMYREIISRPGIDLILKRDAEKRINQIQG